MPLILRTSFALALSLSIPPFALAAPTFAKKAVSPATSTSATTSTTASATPASDPLPDHFAGWQRTAAPEISADPQVADAANVPVLKEYGFDQLATASYIDGDNKLTLRELRFVDATGAYGAFTFYRVPGTSPEQIGREAAANGKRVLFWQGATLVDATFDHLTVMSAAALRELAGRIPVPSGAKSIPPSLPGYLPTQDREVTFTRYAIGPEAYVRSGGVLPVDLVDFNRGAEVLTGTFSEKNGEGQLTLIEYPTPQIAIDRERAIAAFLKAGNPADHAAAAQSRGQSQSAAATGVKWSQALSDSNASALVTRRSGPLVAVTSGGFDDKDAASLIDRVHYEASVSWNKPQTVSEPTRAARLLVGVITLFFILGGITILLGIFFGGGRLLLRKMQGKPASSVDEAEFIKLDLK